MDLEKPIYPIECQLNMVLFMLWLEEVEESLSALHTLNPILPELVELGSTS